MRRYTWIIVSLVGAAFFLGAIGLNIQHGIQASAAEQWATASGRITQSEVRHNENGRARDTFEPRARYTYQAAGRTFASDRIWLLDPVEWETPEQAQAIADRHFSAGQSVQVRYDPADPGNAALILQQADRAAMFVVGGLGLLVLAGGLLFRRRLGATR